MKMNCYTRLSIQSMFSELKNKLYPDLNYFIGIDVEEGSTCISAETSNDNIGFRVQEKKNYTGIYVTDIDDVRAEIATAKVVNGLFTLKYSDTQKVYKTIKACMEYLSPENVVANTVVSMMNALLDNAFCNVDNMKHIGCNYDYTDGFRFKIMGTKTVDGLVWGVKDNKIVLTALSRPNVKEEKLIEELNENILIATNVYAFVDSVQVIQN